MAEEFRVEATSLNLRSEPVVRSDTSILRAKRPSGKVIMV